MGWIRRLNFFGYNGRSLIAVLAVTSLTCQQAGAQVFATIQNSHVRASLGESGQISSMNVTGRFIVEDVYAPHLTSSITSIPIMYGPTVDRVGTGGSVNVPGSFLTVRIDGGNQAGGADMIFGESVATAPSTWTGQWVLMPTALGNHIIARWSTVASLPGVTPIIPSIEVAVDITLVGDMVKYQFTVINGIPDAIPPVVGSQTHTVGLRFAQNYAPDSASFVNEGPVYPSNSGAISTETLLTGINVPPSWRLFVAGGGTANLDNSTGGNLSPLIPDPAFIVPDALSFANAGMLYPTDLWDFTVSNIPGFNFAKDLWDMASGVYWYPRVIGPNQQLTFTTYFGLQHATIDGSLPWAAYVDGPLSLSYNPNGVAGKTLTPNPFVINAGVYNTRDIDLTNVTATINLPAGLTLAPGQLATQSTGNLQSKTENSFRWTVVPDGNASGRISYSVSFSSGPGIQGKNITRDIDIPALPGQNYFTGLQMVSFPYSLDDPTPTVALGLPQTSFDLLRWNNVLNEYDAVSSIVPGLGYWLRMNSTANVTLVGSHPVPAGTAPFEIKLTKGWQQIGNPFLVAVKYADVRVINTGTDPSGFTPLTIDQAATSGLINPVLFRFDPSQPPNGGYTWDQDMSTLLVPFQGYWIKALQDNVTLLIPPPAGRSIKSGISKVASMVTGDAWKVRLMASAANSADLFNYFGVSSSASNGVGTEDVEKPPFIQQNVNAGFVQTTGSRATTYAQDLKAPGGRKVWNFVVSSPKPNTDVTLAWTDTVKVPKNYELVITDDASGTRTSMRQRSSLKVNTGQTGSRSVTITAEPRSGSNTLVITGQPNSTRGTQTVSLSVNTSMDATFAVKVKDAAGNLVRNLVSGRAASSTNQTNVVWDQKDNKGTSMPTGTYQLIVTATTPDGQAATRVFYHTVVR